MADRKISDLTALTTPATGDLIPIVDVSEAAAADKNKSITVGELLRGAPDGTAAAPGFAFESDGGNGMFLGGTDILAFSTGGTQAITIDASQQVGIGTSAPKRLLHLNGGNETVKIQITNTTTGSTTDGEGFQVGIATDGTAFVEQRENLDLFFSTSNDEKLRIDNSGRLLVGTSTARTINGYDVWQGLQLAGATGNEAIVHERYSNDGGGAHLFFGKSRGSSVGSYTSVQSGDALGQIVWCGADGTDMGSSAASIRAVVDGTPGANDMPGRLVFSTTADGASSPTERMRIASDGDVLVGKTSSSFTVDGHTFNPNGYYGVTRTSATPFFVTRNGTDGTLVGLLAQDVQEGNISVSGTTVSYNGAHLSRWSQLPNGEERTEILRGSVLSNIDEMCEWGEEENEQLNRMKVSDVEGDKNVAGVFQAWDDDDDTYTNDFYCAMTGDFVIRIGAGVTVERGDLLMSAGDGTAKPQDDDIIRSKTIAKVTSTNVSCTYDDGSYCVPCVLMAC